MSIPARQRQIYFEGISGTRPRVSTDASRLEELAERKMSKAGFAYIAAGAGTGSTMRANRAAFERHRIVPRMLRDASERDLSVELFGRRLETPLLVSPIGVLDLARRGGDLAVARAASRAGIPMVFSNQASAPMEEMAAQMGDSPRWFQLYWSAHDEVIASFVSRAEACGCEAIVLTLDTTLLGWRPLDLDVAKLPFSRGMGIAQYTSDPVFMRLVDEWLEVGSKGAPQPKPSLAAIKTLLSILRNHPGRALDALRSGRARAAVQMFTETYSRPSLRWEELGFLREQTELPILLKGILDPGDARRAIDAGVDGIIVSNHGGRQVDGAIATLDALPSIVDAVGGRVPVLLDSGIRSGADVFKALALGARAVLIGRPWVYGLAIAGEKGVREVLENFQADLDLTVGLSGHRSVAELSPDALAPG